MTRLSRRLALGAVLVPVALSGQEPAEIRLTLGDAARMAAERGVTVLEARARADAAEARVTGALSELLPSVDADVYTGGRTFNTASFGLDFPTVPGQSPFFDPEGEVVGPVKSADLRARIEVPLLDLGAVGRRREARAGLDAARRAEDATADGAASAAARAYVATLRARAEVVARDEDLRLAEELLDVARGSVESGVGVAIDVTRAESQLATIRAQRLAADHRARAAELALRRMLRLSDDAILELTDELAPLPGMESPDESDAIALALRRRSDLWTAEAYRTAALEAVSATRAGRLPRLSASVDEGFYGRRFGHMLNTYSWTVGVAVPLFDGFDRSSRVREQRAAADEIAHRIEGLREDVVFQVRQALLDLDSAREQADALAERERLARLEVDQEEERVRAGVSGTADLVRAAQRLNEARTAQLDALAAVLAARVGLAAATGTVRELR